VPPPVIGYAHGLTDPLVTSTEAALREPLQHAGAVPIVIPRASRPQDVDRLLDLVDGVLLSGGRDVNPELYGAPPHPTSSPIVIEHDRLELALAAGALDRGLPILGLCRGAQVLAVARGGTLVQDLPSERPSAVRHSWSWVELVGVPPGEHWHPVDLEPGTLVAEWMDEVPLVNSFHHQAVDRVPEPFVVTARAPDGIVEAIEWRDAGQWAVGVQWHGEYMWQHDERYLRPFAALVEAARAHARSRC
jgi:putative glutamine amidotransferase